MSVSIELSESQLKLAVFKIALSLVGIVALVAVVLSLLADRGQSVALGMLFTCLAFYFLTNGILAILKVVDWFEARRAH